MQLTIEHLAPYLPHGLNGFNDSKKVDILSIYLGQQALQVSNEAYDIYYLKIIDFKPLLRPLSQLTQEIEHNGERFVPIYKLFDIEYKDTAHVENIREMYINVGTRFLSCSHLGTAVELSINIQEIEKNNYWKIKKFHEWHFDLYSLIEQGLALPIKD